MQMVILKIKQMTRKKEIKVLLRHLVIKIFNEASAIENTPVLNNTMGEHLLSLKKFCTDMEDLREEHNKIRD